MPRLFIWLTAGAIFCGLIGAAVAQEPTPSPHPNACYAIDQAAGMFKALEKSGFTVTLLAGPQMNAYLHAIGAVNEAETFAAIAIIVVSKESPETPNAAIFYLDAAGRVVCALGGVPFTTHRHVLPSA